MSKAFSRNIADIRCWYHGCWVRISYKLKDLNLYVNELCSPQESGQEWR